MHQQLITYINQQIERSLTEEECTIIQNSFVLKKLRKHQFLLQEDEVCKWAGFIVKGALKQYILDVDGKENILGLCIENWWAGDRESFSTGKPSSYFIQATEASELLVITKENFERNLSSQGFIADLFRTLTEKQSLQLLKRVHVTKSFTAEQRLKDLENNYPEFIQRFPQHIIASYLGMTKETLSRVRSGVIKK